MDFPKAKTPYSSPASRRLIAMAAVLALAIYAAILARNVGAVAGGSDESGYMNHARALASGRLHVQPRIIEGLPQSSAPPFLYVPLGFKPALKGNGLVPTYPTGFPIFVLLLSPFSGWRHAGDAVIILHSLAGLVATYALGRVLGLGRRWSAVGAAIVAASPLYLYLSIVAMSDVPSLLWTTLAVLAALKSRSNMRWALGAGCAIAIDVLLRPTNALAFVPVGIALGASFRRWIGFVLGGLPGVIFFCAHNFAAYGRFVTTGYGDGIVFLASFIPETLLHYARWIPALFTPIAVFCLGLPWLASEGARIRWILGTWIFAFTSFYSAYQCTHETWWYLRFLLPAVPAMVVGGLLVCRALLTKIPGHSGPGPALAAFVTALALVAGNSFLWGRELEPLSIGRGELKYGLICEWMTKNLQPNAVIAAMEATGAIHYYTNFTFIRFDAMDSANVARVEAFVRNSQRPLYAVLFPFEIGDMHAIDKRMPGHWIQVGNVDDVTIWRRNFDTANLILERPAADECFVVEGPAELRINQENGYLVRADYDSKKWWLPERGQIPGKSSEDFWRWSMGDSTIAIHNPQSFPMFADISFGLATEDSRSVIVTAGGNVVWQGPLRPAEDNQAMISGVELQPGDTVLLFRSDRPPANPSDNDQRRLAFSVRDLTISLKGKRQLQSFAK